MKPSAEPRFNPYEVRSFVLDSTRTAEATRTAARELKKATSQTLDRIHESQKRIDQSDDLINWLSRYTVSRR